jgi:hypothetical protein
MKNIEHVRSESVFGRLRDLEDKEIAAVSGGYWTPPVIPAPWPPNRSVNMPPVPPVSNHLKMV